MVKFFNDETFTEHDTLGSDFLWGGHVTGMDSILQCFKVITEPLGDSWVPEYWFPGIEIRSLVGRGAGRNSSGGRQQDFSSGGVDSGGGGALDQRAGGVGVGTDTSPLLRALRRGALRGRQA